MFSSDSAEIGTVLDKRGEACYACHAEGKPLEKVDINARARVFKDPDGTRVLGIINPIPNEPSCYTADCHAHGPQQSLLGVLDVNVSLAEADREMAHGRNVMVALAALAVLLQQPHHLVAQPEAGGEARGGPHGGRQTVAQGT